MKKLFCFSVLTVLFTGLSLSTAANNGSPVAEDQNNMEWRAGTAEVVITPEHTMWMAGYGARNRPSEGTRHDLWAKALALEDQQGRRSVLVTTDLLGLPKGISDRIRDRLEERYGLSRARIILNSSHTHTGPVLQNSLVDIYPLNARQEQLVERYSRELEDEMVALVGEALDSMRPARIYADNGVTRFAVNRRNNAASTLDRATELEGPSDYAVPVLKVETANGELLAVAFGYSCHPTVLSDYLWSGDWPGYAQIELGKTYPEATVLFFQAAGADQNPLPRRSAELAEQYGKSIAAAVTRVLRENEMRPLSSQLSAAYSEIDLALTSPPTREDLIRIRDESSGYQSRWAARMLRKLDRDESFRTSYPYPVQVWKLGDQPIVSLGGELVVDYAIEIKRIFGQHTFIMGYSNDVMSYIPSARIIREGGYEGASSQMVYGLPSTWSTGIETEILDEVLRLAAQAGVEMPETSVTRD